MDVMGAEWVCRRKVLLLSSLQLVVEVDHRLVDFFFRECLLHRYFNSCRCAEWDK